MLLYDNILGYYKPACFYIRINTNSDLSNIMTSSYVSTFIHEYVHFLQDIGTRFGLFNLSHAIEKMVSLAKKMYKHPENEIVIRPVMREYKRSVEINVDLMSIYFGSDMEIDNVKQCGEIDIELNLDRLIDEAPDVTTCYLVIDGKKYHIGARQIMESMAYEIENAYFHNDNTFQDIPYKMVRLLIEKRFGYIVDPRVAIALCDVCLDSYHPSEELYHFINRKENISSVEKIYSLHNETVYRTYQANKDSNCPKTYNEMSDEAIEIIKLAIREPKLEKMTKWLCDSIMLVRDMREYDQYFLPNIIQQVDNLDGISLIVRKVGAPLFFNNKQESFLIDEGIIKDDPDKVVYWTALDEVFKFISNKDKQDCCLYSYCNQFNNILKNDLNCRTAPNRRSNKEYENLCYFGAIFKTTGLSKYKWE